MIFKNKCGYEDSKGVFRESKSELIRGEIEYLKKEIEDKIKHLESYERGKFGNKKPNSAFVKEIFDYFLRNKAELDITFNKVEDLKQEIRNLNKRQDKPVILLKEWWWGV